MSNSPTVSIGNIQWAANDNALTWKLIDEMTKLENFKVLFGKSDKKENTSGDTKIAVCKRIAEQIVPHLFPDHATVAGERIRNKISELQKQYIKHSKKLRQTGGGLGGPGEESQDQEGGGDQYLAFYIHPDGPDHDTDPVARNIWEKIEQEFPFFPILHSFLSTRPNAVPIAVTTGVGPAGPQTLHLQAPSADTEAEPVAPAAAAPPPPAAVPPATAALPVASAPPAAHPAQSQPANAAASVRSFGTPLSVNNPTQTPQRGAPRPSTNLIESAKAKIIKLPQKRSFEEDGIELIKFQINASNRRERADRLVKKRKILMEEFKMEIWTKEEYRRKVRALDAEEAEGDKENVGAPQATALASSSSSSSILGSSSDIDRDD